MIVGIPAEIGSPFLSEDGVLVAEKGKQARAVGHDVDARSRAVGAQRNGRALRGRRRGCEQE
jgi:hypothetical protein